MSEITKPLYGQPCNNCGLCCLSSQCPVSKGIFGDQDLCPAIEMQKGGGLTCGLIRSSGDYVRIRGETPAAVGEAVATILGGGVGCDMVFGDVDATERERLEKVDPLRDRARATYDAASEAAKRVIAKFGGSRP